ncbi:OHCU decarboxylase [Arthrobacter crystallopoietes BAB-32]|uniref:2-oxo-4-hydroxy-4-carboxy-5-ureidoimidazoline decarboxylase n=1 Tax=Arthrobacter crystallopoietes BAB-32 TaxID=1246476 RepID=N1V0L2_9MICC|nr:2-oxo-4-hydroxy-4-carboxy-5-ureidoimidazoline decarboxylase [Arthrobacter crystallopoietes]EMY36196.1 OHCU decarboxylase [Arthrobacter crystallopoietes BAB-32]
MDFSTFNHAQPAEAAAVLRPCVDITRWVEEIVALRPFASRNELIEFAGRAANPWTAEEIDGALAHHPRIGERAAGNSAEAGMSRKEQSGVVRSPEVQAALEAGNRAYEEKFDRVFLIRAAGRSAEEILEQLQKRLHNSPDEEIAVVAQQLREIAVLRLEGAIEA